jgi:hypothetical protein
VLTTAGLLLLAYAARLDQKWIRVGVASVPGKYELSTHCGVGFGEHWYQVHSD